MKTLLVASALVLAVSATLSSAVAKGPCVTKGAIATAESEKSAKWYALETMVQAVSWSLWPGFVATNTVEGYTIKNERYKCKPEGSSVTCRGRADFCKN